MSFWHEESAPKLRRRRAIEVGHGHPYESVWKASCGFCRPGRSGDSRLEYPSIGHSTKWLELAGLRENVAFAQAEHGVSECRACKLLGVDRASYRYELRPESEKRRQRLPDAGLVVDYYRAALSEQHYEKFIVATVLPQPYDCSQMVRARCARSMGARILPIMKMFAVKQIVSVLKQAAAVGIPVAELFRSPRDATCWLRIFSRAFLPNS